MYIHAAPNCVTLIIRGNTYFCSIKRRACWLVATHFLCTLPPIPVLLSFGHTAQTAHPSQEPSASLASIHSLLHRFQQGVLTTQSTGTAGQGEDLMQTTWHVHSSVHVQCRGSTYVGHRSRTRPSRAIQPTCFRDKESKGGDGADVST